MDWKEILRRRLAMPNTGPNSEFGRGRPQKEPGSKLPEVGGGWAGAAPGSRAFLLGKASPDKGG